LVKKKIESETEIQAFLDAINDFWVAYIDNCDGSVTTKIHLLVMHAEWYLRTYGTIGFFTEDALESIHAIVNRLAKTYAALDKTRRGTQILRAMASRKSEMLDRVKEETEKYGEKGKKRIRARQGSKPVLQIPREDSNIEKAIDEALADFFGNDKTQLELTLQLTESENPFEYPTDTTLVECKLCRSGLSQDVFIPSTLAKLHHLVVHQEVEDRQKSSTKKQK
jgi:di/tripeptidase